MPVALQKIRSRTAPLAKTAAMHLGAYAALRSLLPSRRIAILRYHAICGPEGYAYADPAICITPAAFERHVAYLASSYSVWPLRDAVAALKRRAPLPPNAVAITFDDGYADNLVAARILHRFGLSGTFFITAGCLAGEQPFWPAEVRALIGAVKGPRLRLIANGVRLEIPLRDDVERAAAMKTVSQLFKANPISVREALREQLRRAAGTATAPACMLRWDDVAELHRLGMTIGAHTLTHPNLPNADPSDAWREIDGSRKRLEHETGAPVTLFAYPNGGAERYMTPTIASMVERAGFVGAATSANGFAGPHSNLFALERIQVYERLEDLVFALEVERFAFQPAPRCRKGR
jgi:peptidoglycan/xylan/chitin deacetylase (PgdA/CDA1 family)